MRLRPSVPGGLTARCDLLEAAWLEGVCAFTLFAKDTVSHAWVYFEEQVGLQCGVHAANFLLQGPWFSGKQFDKLAKKLDKEEKAPLSFRCFVLLLV